jgi:hypothetical protein
MAMTVGELIAALSAFPADLDVQVYVGLDVRDVVDVGDEDVDIADPDGEKVVILDLAWPEQIDEAGS